MKFNNILLFFLGGAFLFTNAVSAQLVSDNIFLQGRWLEVGVAANGSWGNTVSVPAAYHTHTGTFTSYIDPVTGTTASGNGLDFSYDVGHDGWTTGSPVSGTNCCFYGAYFLPGTPFDGWAIQMNGVRSDAYYTTGGFALGAGATSFSGTNNGYSSDLGSPCGPYLAGSMAGFWSGSYTAGGQTVAIHTTNRLDTNASWEQVNVVFKNTGATTATGLYYLVTADPDNDEVIPGSFATNNHIVYQNDAQHRVEVCARPPAPTHQDAFSGLATKDCRAKALIYQSWPSPITVSLSSMWSVTGTNTLSGLYTSKLDTTTISQDWAYALVYNLGDLAPGDSTTISFAWIFSDTSAIDSAFPAPQLAVNCALAPAIDTFHPCDVGVSTFPVNIVNGQWGTNSWTWTPSIGLSTTVGITNTVNVLALTAPTTYTIIGTDTSSCNHFKLLLTVYPCFSASSNSPGTGTPPMIICVDDTLKLRAHGDSTSATYLWYHDIPGPLVGSPQYVDIPHVPLSDTGWYYVVKTVGLGHDTTKTHVLLQPKPIINATSNSPICSGNTLILTSSPDSVGETWVWSGPLGFGSVLSDPTITPAITANSGIYKVIASFKGCIDSAFVTAVVDSTPEVPALGSNSPVCSGDTLKLTSIENTPGVTYQWNGPNTFASTLANPNIPNVTIAATGIYTLTVTLGTCTNTNTVNVLINPTPIPVLGTNSPVCSGTILDFTESGGPAGSTYVWTGPNSFSSTDQNPAINPAITANTGTYSVVVTLNGCPSAVTTIYAVVDTTPELPVVSTNSPGPPGPSICEGDTLKLNAFSTTAGVNYSWFGPNSFSSSLQNPFINPATPAATGFYTVTVSVVSCSVTAILTATITGTPPIYASSNSPVCTGILDTVFLQASTSGPGGEYAWSGPYVFTTSAQNPFRTPVIAEYGGVYHVSVLLNGCTNDTSITVVVNQTPAAPWVKWLTYCQFYDAPPLMATGSNLLWFNSSLGGINTPVPPVPQTATTGWAFYFVNQTVLNCPSAIDSIKVQVNPKPTVTVNGAVQVCPHDTVVLTATDTDPIAYYHWRPTQYVDDSTSAITIVRPETDVVYSVIATNQYDCTDTATVKVSVHPGAVITLTDSVTLYPGESFQMDPLTNCSTLRWTPSGGLTSAYISNPIATPVVSTRYYVTGISEWGCKTRDSIDVNIATDAVLNMPNAFAPGNGANGTFKVVKRGIAQLIHFRVYDRWGVVVFEAKDIDDGWDGTYKGVPQPVGVYVYEISAVSSTSGAVFNKAGNVTLLR